MSPDFVRITFREPGARRARTIWAERGTRTPDGKLSFWRVDRHGERPDPEEVVIGSEAKFETILPARMNLHYGELETIEADGG